MAESDLNPQFEPTPDPAAGPAPLSPPQRPLLRNPFADDVCADPLGVEETRSVAGMNKDVVSQIATAIDERHLNAG